MALHNLYISAGGLSAYAQAVLSSVDPMLAEAQTCYLQFLGTKPADSSLPAFQAYLSRSGSDYLKQHVQTYSQELLLQPASSFVSPGGLADLLSRDSDGAPLTLIERLSRGYTGFFGPQGASLVGGPDPTSSGAPELTSLVSLIRQYQDAKNRYDSTPLNSNDWLVAQTDMGKAASDTRRLVAAYPLARSAAQMLLLSARLGLLSASTDADQQAQALAYSDFSQGDQTVLTLLSYGLENAHAHALSKSPQMQPASSIDMAKFHPVSDAFSIASDFTGAQSLVRGYNIHYDVKPSKEFRSSYPELIAGDLKQVALKQGFSPPDAELMGELRTPDLKSLKIIIEVYSQVKGASGQPAALSAAQAAARALDVDFGSSPAQAIVLYAKLLAQPLLSVSSATHEHSVSDPAGLPARVEELKSIYPQAQTFFQDPNKSIKDFIRAQGFALGSFESNSMLSIVLAALASSTGGDASKKSSLVRALGPLGWTSAQISAMVDGADVPIKAQVWCTSNQKPGEASLAPYGVSSYNDVMQEARNNLQAMGQALIQDSNMLFTTFLLTYIRPPMSAADIRELQTTNPELSALKLSDVYNSNKAELDVATGTPDSQGVYSGGKLAYARVVYERKKADYILPVYGPDGKPKLNSDGSVQTAPVSQTVFVPRECKKDAAGDYPKTSSDFFYAPDAKAEAWWDQFAFGSRRLHNKDLQGAISSDFEKFGSNNENWENFQHFMTLLLKLRRNYGVGIMARNGLHLHLPDPVQTVDAGRLVQLPAEVYLEGPKDSSGTPSFSQAYASNPDMVWRFIVLDPSRATPLAQGELATAPGQPMRWDTSSLPAPDFSQTDSFSSIGPAAYAGQRALNRWAGYDFNFTPTTLTSYPYLIQVVRKGDQPLSTGTPYPIPLDHGYNSILFPSDPAEANAAGLINVRAVYPVQFSLYVRNAGGLIPFAPDLGQYDLVWAGREDLQSSVVRVSSQTASDPASGLLDYDHSKGMMVLKLTGGSSLPNPEVLYQGKPDNTLVVFRNLPIKWGVARYHQDELDFYTHQKLGEQFYLTKPELASTDLHRALLPPITLSEPAPILRASDLPGALKELSSRGVSVQGQVQMSNAQGLPIDSWEIDAQAVPNPFPRQDAPPESGTLYFVRRNRDSGQYEVFRSRTVQSVAPTPGRLPLEAEDSGDGTRNLYDNFTDPADPSRVMHLRVGEATRNADGTWSPQLDMLALLYNPDPAVQAELERRYGPYLQAPPAQSQTDDEGALPPFSVQNTTAQGIGISAAPDYLSPQVKAFVERLRHDLFQFKLAAPGADPDKTGLALHWTDGNLLDPSGTVLFENVKMDGRRLNTPAIQADTDKLVGKAYRAYLAPAGPLSTPIRKTGGTPPAPNQSP